MYRYVAVDTMTGAYQGDLNLTGVTWERGLNASGSINANLVISDIERHPEIAREQVELTTPGRMTVLVLKDDRVVCDGFWLPDTSDADMFEQMQASRLWNMFRYRHITELRQYNSDLSDIVVDLLEYGQDRAGGDLNLNYDCPPTDLVRELEWVPWSNTKIAEAVESLSDGIFDFDLTVRADGYNRFSRHFRIHQPRQGGENPDVRFNVPDWKVSRGLPENVVTVLGEGSGLATVTATADRPDLLETWPRFEMVIAAKDLTEYTDVATLAQARVDLMGLPPVTHQLTVNQYDWWEPGDVVTVEYDPSRRFPQGHTSQQRIVNTRCAVSDEGNEQVTVTFADSLAALPQSRDAAIAALDRRLRNLE